MKELQDQNLHQGSIDKRVQDRGRNPPKEDIKIQEDMEEIDRDQGLDPILDINQNMTKSPVIITINVQVQKGLKIIDI